MITDKLMSGNWINFEGLFIQVADVLCDSVNTTQHEALPYDMIDGVQLTPEILEKCGFGKTPPVRGSFNWYHKSGCFGLAENNIQGLIYCSPFLDLPMVSLHQLQNTFYTNTGTELTIAL